MKYNISYDKADFDAAIEYVNKNNPYLAQPWSSETLMKYIRDTSDKNYQFIRTGVEDEHWITYVSTGGVTLIFSYDDSKTKKGYPIIDVDISVYPSFDKSNHVYEKVRM